MALPNGAGGYQLGDGNLTEIILGTQPAPTAKTAAATLTAAELATGIITYTGAAVALTVPTGADLDATNGTEYHWVVEDATNNELVTFVMLYAPLAATALIAPPVAG